MLSGHLRETIMRVYDTRPTTAESIMDIAELVESVAKREYSRGRKDQSEKSVQWIPCSERLPEENVPVLGTFKFQGGNACLTTERIIVNGEERWSASCGMTPIAWMPLPEPYKGAEE